VVDRAASERLALEVALLRPLIDGQVLISAPGDGLNLECCLPARAWAAQQLGLAPTDCAGV
jgi:hypothetical protein